MKLICQYLILIWLFAFFLRRLWSDFNGVNSREAGGFWGAVSSIVAVAIFALVLWGAGAFTGL